MENTFNTIKSALLKNQKCNINYIMEGKYIDYYREYDNYLKFFKLAFNEKGELIGINIRCVTKMRGNGYEHNESL